MKYQNFAIIFILIIVPISVVLSYYIQTQTDTLALETIYKTKLNDSTYDAVASYQMNSLNTQHISGESVKSYVLASVNTFFTTLATNMGMSSASKNILQTYVPAILFTTYDGYYIYSPTKTHMLATIPGGLPGGAEEAGRPIFTKDRRFIYLMEGYERVVAQDGATKPEVSYNDVVAYGNQNPVPPKDTTHGLTINPTANDVDYNYMLKPFIYYSANYKKDTATDKYNVVASYTLDNYLTVYGEKSTNRDDATAEDYYTTEFSKSGYLIDPTKLEITGSILVELMAKDQTDTATPKWKKKSRQKTDYAEAHDFQGVADCNGDPDPLTLGKNNTRYLVVNITNDPAGYLQAYNYINYYDYKKDYVIDYPEGSITEFYSTHEVAHKGDDPIRKRTGDEIIKDTLDIQFYNFANHDHDILNLTYGGAYTPLTVKYNGIDITDRDAMEYYIKAFFFSQWVQRNLSDIPADSIDLEAIEQDRDNQFAYLWHFGDEKIFSIDKSKYAPGGGEVINDPEDEGSLISQHKRDVVKNSIQLNLNTAISTYNTNHGRTQGNDFLFAAYELPQLTEKDWDSILNNICMVSFMQGMPCGNTTFNDYAVVKSNNNNTSVSIDNLYFTKKRDNKIDKYHKIDCPNLADNVDLTDPEYYYDADLSAEFKYDPLKLKSKVAGKSPSGLKSEEEIVCFFEEEHEIYYKVVCEPGSTDRRTINIENLKVGDVISDGETYTPDGSPVSYTRADLMDLMNGTADKYIYDHKNEGCYNCIIGSNYTPVVRYYKGQLYQTYESETGELLMYINTVGAIGGGQWYYADGTPYDESRLGKDSTVTPGYTSQTQIEGLITDGKMIPMEDLKKRRKALYTHIAKIRKGLYKTNGYINR